MTTTNLIHDYNPREWFRPFHLRRQRWAQLVAHRRLGKTVAVVNDLISRASYLERDDGRYAYVAPYYGQAKRIAWSYFKHYAGPLSRRIYESDLSINLRHNNALLSLFGADNPDSFRGLYFDGVILDEFGDMKPHIWSEILLPTLLDRRGWATFIGTPNGPNHFRDQRLRALADPDRWYSDLLPVSRTHHFPEDELHEMRQLMLPEEYEREMECSFEVSARGAFYSVEMAQTLAEGRIGVYPPDQSLLLHFVFDIGRTDDTALGAFQETPLGANMVHAEMENMRGPQYWLQRISEICAMYGCSQGVVWLPHDAKAKTWATQRSGVEQFVDGGIRPRIVPSLDKLDGINAARYVFKYVTFNEESTKELILALKSYHRAYDEDKKAFTNDDVHDWSSHPADMFRYFALVAQFPHSRPLEIPKEDIPTPPLRHYPFSLDDLWEQNDGNRHAGIR